MQIMDVCQAMNEFVYSNCRHFPRCVEKQTQIIHHEFIRAKEKWKRKDGISNSKNLHYINLPGRMPELQFK